MRKVRRNDYYSIKRNPYFSYFDVRFLLDLYTPLIGASATAVYLALQEDNYSKADQVATIGALLDSVKLTGGEFEQAVSYLEGIGLVKTYLTPSKDEVSYFAFELFPPYSPADFFADPLLYGTLLRYIGEENMSFLHKKYACEPFNTVGMKDVSISFRDRYTPLLDEKYYLSPSPQAQKREQGTIATDFELGAFQNTLRNLLVDPHLLNQGDLNHVEKIAGLYGLSSKTCGELAAESFSFSSGRQFFDRKIFSAKAEKVAPYVYFHQEKGQKSQVSSKTNLARKIHQMDSFPPEKWLSIKQNGHRPAQNDLKLLRTLSLNMGIPNGVINAVIDYCLARNNNILSANFVEKVAATLMREGCKTARDAMEYLKDSDNRFHKKRIGQSEPAEDINKENKTVASKEEESEKVMTEEDLESFLKELGLAKKDKKPKN